MQALVLDKTRKLDRARNIDKPAEPTDINPVEKAVGAVTNLSEEAFARIWDNPKDADYDDL
jgi:hypothetical protein